VAGELQATAALSSTTLTIAVPGTKRDLMPPALPNAVELSHTLAASRLEPGAFAVDATCGNGQDTLFLARAVGPRGFVYACDIQEEAIRRTEHALREAGLLERVVLDQVCHSALLDRLWERRGTASAILFNLGYLPGGDHALITQPATTRRALNAAKAIVKPGGILSVVVYSGHPGGKEERRAVLAWARSLPQDRWTSVRYEFLNQRNHPPSLLAIEPRPG
jgi:predicted methyltransferase